VAQCPNCGNQLNDDFGLVECARCGAALFLEFDGTVQRRDGVAGRTPPPPSSSSPSEGEKISFEASEFLGNPETDLLINPDPSEAAMTGAPDEPLEFENVSGPHITNSESIPLHAAPPMVLPDPPVAGRGFGDLSEFANSNLSTGRDGAYLYDLYISGIDSSDVRNAVNEILRDQLFLWDAEQLLRTITNGEMKLTQVTSVKASVLVQRLGELAVRVRWVQHALSEA